MCIKALTYLKVPIKSFITFSFLLDTFTRSKADPHFIDFDEEVLFFFVGNKLIFSGVNDPLFLSLIIIFAAVIASQLNRQHV
jgi:hypothetical protein